MNILSLFDGMSCGQIALNRAGIKYNQYFASEIDKHAIKVTQHNYPSTIQLGDVCAVKGYTLPQIDLLLGGSPCQGFSIAGTGLNFEDPRSKLFFEYVRILNELRETNPDVRFLLENVRMKKEWQDVISEALGVQPIYINSAIVSAQTRKRLYWTNIEGVTQPVDKGLLLKDVLENAIEFDGTMSEEPVQVNPSKEAGGKQPYMQNRVYHPNGKSVALTQFASRLKVLENPYLTSEQILKAVEKYRGKTWKSGNKMGNMKFPDPIDKKSRCLTATRIIGARETMHINDGVGIRNLTPLESLPHH